MSFVETTGLGVTTARFGCGRGGLLLGAGAATGAGVGAGAGIGFDAIFDAFSPSTYGFVSKFKNASSRPERAWSVRQT